MSRNDTLSTNDGHDGDSSQSVERLGQVPVCLGCGLMGEVEAHNGLCLECWHRRERRLGGGQLRVVTPSWTYHETPLCPAVRNASEWRYWRDEDCCYADLGGDMDKCVRCHSHSLYGFDEFVGDEERQKVIGHA